MTASELSGIQLEKSISALMVELAEQWPHAQAIAEQALQGRGVVVYGCGTFGRPIARHLRSCGVTVFCFAVDSPDPLIGQLCDDVPVLALSDAVARYGKAACVIATFFHAYGHRYIALKGLLEAEGCTVISYLHYCWRFPDYLLPYYFVDLPSRLLESEAAIQQAAALFNDDASRTEYLLQLRYRAFPDVVGFNTPVDHKTDYWPVDLVQRYPRNVMIDCGAYDGDTLRDFFGQGIDACEQYVAVEPDPLNFARLTQTVSKLPPHLGENITCLNAAVGAYCGRVGFSATAGDGSSTTVARNLPHAIAEHRADRTEVAVSCMTLDSIRYKRPPTMVKMDIEGAEKDALRGAHQLIENESPFLAICAYHRQADVWDLPTTVAHINPSYRFFLRRFSSHAWDTVLFCAHT